MAAFSAASADCSAAADPRPARQDPWWQARRPRSSGRLVRPQQQGVAGLGGRDARHQLGQGRGSQGQPAASERAAAVSAASRAARVAAGPEPVAAVPDADGVVPGLAL